jgi:hypothetical protein
LNPLLQKFKNTKVYGLLRGLCPTLVVLTSVAALTNVCWRLMTVNTIPLPPALELRKTSLFTHNYPANDSFRKELVQLRNTNALKASDELEIQKSVLASTDYLEIPPAILWCLLFQESRLNHLEGFDSDKPALGLGQFSWFSFFEINHQQNHFNPDSSNLFLLTYGRDVRPIAAKKRDFHSPSSYYSIPTAVTSSAIYLHNRYFQLTHLLDKRSIPYDPDILWLFSAMAYNKGTRSVLSLWNTIQTKKGKEQFERLVNDFSFFEKSTKDSLLLTKSLKRIWHEPKARAYSKELGLHIRNISSCSLSPELKVERTLSGGKP